MNIGNNIRKLRRNKNISQKELANLSGLSQAYISTIENNQKNISLKSLEKICNALGIEITKLFNGNTGVLFLDNGVITDNDIYTIVKEVNKLSKAERKKLKNFLIEINLERRDNKNE